MKELTKRQGQVLRFIQSKQDSEGMTPTFREIASHFRFSSANAALAHVQALIAKGHLSHLPGRARSLQLATPNSSRHRPRARVVPIPIYGSIPAGNPQDGRQEEEGCILIDVDTIGIKTSSRTFGLNVRGESMIGKGILDGDVAIIQNNAEPRSGDVVAALIDGEVTLKSFITQRGKPFLRAENPRFPNLIPREELQIQGVMIALIRRCR